MEIKADKMEQKAEAAKDTRKKDYKIEKEKAKSGTSSSSTSS